jgi:alpha-tubulin suppressor-like RCC1 family protein
MVGINRAGMISIGMFLIPALTACGGAGAAAARSTPETPTVWQLPPRFTQTLTASMTFTPSPAVSATPTLPAAQAAAAAPIAAGWNHTCAIDSDGGVLCWGSNDNGQLGDGSRTDRNHAVAVKNLGEPAIALAAGFAHSCALTKSGSVKCWGRNRYGELGNGNTDRSSTPVDVSGLSGGVIAIAAGDEHTCAITAQGGVKCWGFNNLGQLGDGTTDNRSEPVDVAGLSGVIAVAAGTGHTCAATSAGAVLCWGGNALGQLGDGSAAASRPAPGAVPGLAGGIAGLSAKGDHTCVLDGAGGLACWGDNKYGKLGDGTGKNQSAPVAVVGLGDSAASVAAGWSQTCAVLGDASLVCWGWNFYGQIGDDSIVSRLQPVAVKGISGVVSAASGGGGHTCALIADGSMYCWGLNLNGQLGDFTNQDHGVPVLVKGVTVLTSS